jgi:DNA-binding NtrC family response regulator
MERLKIYHAHLNIMLGVLENDKDFLAEFYKRVAERPGITVKMYPSSQDFLEHLSKEIHIAIIDHYVDRMNGLEVVDKIKEVNKYAYIIIVSGQGDFKVLQSYMRKRVFDYIDKRDFKHQDELIDEVLRVVDEAMGIIRHEVDFFSMVQEHLLQVRIDNTANELTNIETQKTQTHDGQRNP